jgi:hypothetical protein
MLHDPQVQAILGGPLANLVGRVFGDIEIAEDEIRIARGRTGDEPWDEADRDDPLWQSFKLLRVEGGMPSEKVYRAHCKEILERVAAGQDTRPGTDAEVMVAISQASQEVPLHGSIVGLQLRMFKRRLPDDHQQLLDALGDGGDYEAMFGREIDEWDGQLRRKATQSWRTL